MPAADITLLPPSGSRTTFMSLSGYDVHEHHAAASSEQPLFKSYNRDADWWDNLVAEQIQARMPVILMASRGTGEGNMNPIELSGLIDAFNRAGVTPNIMKVACFLDTANWGIRAQSIYSQPFDLANNNMFARIVFDENVAPWFNTVPSQWWYRINGRPVIQIWGLNPAMTGGCINHANNYTNRLTWLANHFEVVYGVRPYFVPDKASVDEFWGDSSVRNNPDVYGLNGWFSPPNEPWTVVDHKHRIGTVIPGYVNPSHPTNPNQIIPRNNGSTFYNGIVSTLDTSFTLIEGWTNYQESNALYRSDAPGWSYPNQYINYLQEFNDPDARTMKLEAEACDTYNDFSSGNYGGKFRRGGDLDIQDTGDGNGWNVGWTQAGESIRHIGVFFANGNYRFTLRYSAPGNQQVRLRVKGQDLGVVNLPATGGWQNWDTIHLATGVNMSRGVADVELIFVTGDTNVDWIFIKKE